MFLLHTKLPSFIQQLKEAAQHHGEVPCQVLGLENLETAKVQSARTGRLEREVEELSQVPGAARLEVRILPRIPETLHTVVIITAPAERVPSWPMLRAMVKLLTVVGEPSITRMATSSSPR